MQIFRRGFGFLFANALIFSFVVIESQADELVNIWGMTQLYEAVYHQDPERVERLINNGSNVHFKVPSRKPIPSRAYGRTPLHEASFDPNARIIYLLLEHGADPTSKDEKGESPLSVTSGYLIPGTRYSKDFSSGWLHQLMLTYVDDPSKLDDTMKWQGKGCYGYTVERTDTRLGIIARKVYNDPDRWPELAKLNNISKDNPYRMGDCLKVFDVEW